MTNTPKYQPALLFHADHVGSLLRPSALRQAFRKHQNGQLSAEDFQAVQDVAVKEAIAMQESVGLKAITDGEFRRASYWSHFVEGIDGLAVAPARFQFRNAAGEHLSFLAPDIVAPLHRSGSLSGDAFDYLKSHTHQTPKVTLPSPPTMHFWGRQQAVESAGYADLEAFFADLAAIYKAEIADLYQRGARYLQLDEVPLVMLCDENIRDKVRSDGEDPDRYVDRYIALFNACLAERPRDMHIAMHICRGNFKGHWLTEGSYGYVAGRLFTEVDVDSFFLEYDTPRAGDFAPLKQMPEDKAVILGLISSKVPELEDSDIIRRRVEEAAAYVPLPNLGISPQCGFASAVTGNPVTLDDQKAKLALVVDTAARIWR